VRWNDARLDDSVGVLFHAGIDGYFIPDGHVFEHSKMRIPVTGHDRITGCARQRAPFKMAGAFSERLVGCSFDDRNMGSLARQYQAKEIRARFGIDCLRRIEDFELDAPRSRKHEGIDREAPLREKESSSDEEESL
jgi:hypothetical protein